MKTSIDAFSAPILSPKNILKHFANVIYDEDADINPTPHVKIVNGEEDPVINPAPHVEVVLAKEYPVYDPAPNTEIVFYEDTDVQMDPTPHFIIDDDEEKTEIDC